MVIAREMGFSEQEFWNSDPVFFNEVAEKYYALQRRKMAALLPTK